MPKVLSVCPEKNNKNFQPMGRHKSGEALYRGFKFERKGEKYA